MRPPALTSQHEWYIGGVVVATINPPPDSSAAQLEIAHDKGIPGWFSLPDADDVETDAPAGRRGERPFPRTSRGKTLTYNLQLREPWGRDYGDLAADLGAYAVAFRDQSSLGLMTVTRWEDVGVPGAPIWGTFARVLDFDADDLQAYAAGRQPTPFIRDPILAIRQLDGIWIWLNESGTLFERVVFDAPGAASVLATNNGDIDTMPTVTVYAVTAGQDLHIGRDVGGGGIVDLWFRNPVGASGLAGAQSVVVDFVGGKVSVGAVDVTRTYDAAASSWWDEYAQGIPPGTHNIWHGPGAGTGIKVELYSNSCPTPGTP